MWPKLVENEGDNDQNGSKTKWILVMKIFLKNRIRKSNDKCQEFEAKYERFSSPPPSPPDGRKMKLKWESRGNLEDLYVMNFIIFGQKIGKNL